MLPPLKADFAAPQINDSLTFPQEWFETVQEKKGLFGTKRQVFTITLPFISAFIDALNKEYPNFENKLAMEDLPGMLAEKFKDHPHALNFVTFTTSIEKMGLNGLIYLQFGDTIARIRQNYPDAYEHATNDNGKPAQPLTFSLNLLKEFGIESRDYPACFVALTNKVMGVPHPIQKIQLDDRHIF